MEREREKGKRRKWASEKEGQRQGQAEKEGMKANGEMCKETRQGTRAKRQGRRGGWQKMQSNGGRERVEKLKGVGMGVGMSHVQAR